MLFFYNLSKLVRFSLQLSTLLNFLCNVQMLKTNSI